LFRIAFRIGFGKGPLLEGGTFGQGRDGSGEHGAGKSKDKSLHIIGMVGWEMLIVFSPFLCRSPFLAPPTWDIFYPSALTLIMATAPVPSPSKGS